MTVDMKDLGDCRLLLPAPYGRSEWLAMRHTGIGGSDAAAALGLNTYKSAYETWLEKVQHNTGAASNDLGPDDPMYWGHLLEDDIVQAFEHTTGLTTRRSPGLLASGSYPWMLASPDRFVYDGDQLAGLLECKTVGTFNAQEWGDGQAGVSALVQLHHYMIVCGLTRGWIAGLIGGQRFVLDTVEKHPDLHHQIIEGEREFWIQVQTNHAPLPDGSPSAAAALRRHYPQATEDDAIVLDAVEYAATVRLRDIKERIKNLEREEATLTQRLQDSLGDHALGIYDDRPVVRWTNVATARLDQAALKAEHPEIVDKYTKPDHYRRFTLVKGFADGNK